MTFEDAMAQVAQHTQAACGGCRVPYGCCHKEACEEAIAFSKDHLGVELETTNHPTLPLMGPNGCTAQPHQRPICSVHVCEQHLLADTDWTNTYWELRDQASEALETALFSDEQNT